MRFNKDEVSMGGNYLDEGVYQVTFDDIKRKTTRTGKEMWVITLKDVKTGGTTRKNILDNDTVFKNGKTAIDTDIERMLYSISDAGFSIPDTDYNFDNIDRFLKSKPYQAFIQVRPQKNDPQYNEALFITKEYFNKLSETVDPFAGSTTETDIDTDQLPF